MTGSATGWGTDVLIGIEGVIGSGHGDTITGTSGRNVIRTGAGDDSVDAGSGYDTVLGEDGNDTIIGGFGFDSLDGGAGADSITGDNGNDTLLGADGADTLLGGAGADLLQGGAGDDSLDGGAGIDTASFVGATGPIIANLATQSATGEGTDILLSIENLTGSAFADQLTGDVGDNVIDGGGGVDVLTGGGGADTFRFAAGEAVNGESVTDFSGSGGDGDRLVFVGFGAGATFTNVGGDQWLIASVVDPSDNATITVIGTVTASDFVFI